MNDKSEYKLEYRDIYDALSLIYRVLRQEPRREGIKEPPAEYVAGYYAGIHAAAATMLTDISNLVLDFVPEADGGKEEDF